MVYCLPSLSEDASPPNSSFLGNGEVGSWATEEGSGKERGLEGKRIDVGEIGGGETDGGEIFVDDLEQKIFGDGTYEVKLGNAKLGGAEGEGKIQGECTGEVVGVDGSGVTTLEVLGELIGTLEAASGLQF